MRRVLILVAAVMLLAAACGPSASPKERVVEGIKALGEGGVAVTMTLNSDVESLEAAFEGELPGGVAEKILESALTIETNNAQDPNKLQLHYLINVAGDEDAIEVLLIGSALYIRANVPGILETFGQDPAAADMFVAQAQQAGLTFVGPVVEGEWLEITGLYDMLEQFTGQSVEQQTRQQQKAFEEFGDALEREATVEEGDEEGPGDHLVTTINLRHAFDSLIKLAQSQNPGIPAEQLEAEDIPNETIAIDMWVEGETVNQVEFDFLQLRKFEDADIPEGVEQLALRFTLEEFTEELQAPEDPVTVSADRLFELFMGFEGQASEQGTVTAPAGGSTEDFCKQLRDAPPNVQKQFKKECPEFR